MTVITYGIVWWIRTCTPKPQLLSWLWGCLYTSCWLTAFKIARWYSLSGHECCSVHLMDYRQPPVTAPDYWSWRKSGKCIPDYWAVVNHNWSRVTTTNKGNVSKTMFPEKLPKSKEESVLYLNKSPNKNSSYHKTWTKTTVTCKEPDRWCLIRTPNTDISMTSFSWCISLVIVWCRSYI